jgi:NADH-quinone oxidoreductase subunit L
MRQITLTFLGEPRSDAAGHAHESVRSMTLPLVVLAVFALGIGWIGIPEDFPVIGGLLPNWFHEFVGGTLLEHPHGIEFSFIPLITSLGVAGVGLLIGWLVYRRIKKGQPDPLTKVLGPIYTVLENKYYFDELYGFLFVRPAYWLAEQFSYRFVDRRIIDGVLHWFASLALRVGDFLRNYIDLPIVNGSGDAVGEGVKLAGREFRMVQTGKVQAYLLVGVLFIGIFLAYLLFV